jgi:hypothetical protein
VGYRYTEQPLPDGSMRFKGTGAEALEAATRIVATEENPFNWIAAVHEGPCALADDPSWIAFQVTERPAHEWTLASEQTGAHLRYLERAHAVSYAAFQARGKTAVVRVIKRDGQQQSLLLIDQRGAEGRRISSIAADPGGHHSPRAPASSN